MVGLFSMLQQLVWKVIAFFDQTISAEKKTTTCLSFKEMASVCEDDRSLLETDGSEQEEL